MPEADSNTTVKKRRPRSFPSLEGIEGQQFGHLTVVSCDLKSRKLTCDCVCGKRLTVYASFLFASSPKRSCGCRWLRVKHGHARRDKIIKNRHAPSQSYRSWAMMKSRCSDPNNPAYSYYGGRGIAFCARWQSFEAFLADMGEPPTKQHSIDRIDVNGNYEPSNCRWATKKEQQRNRRDSVFHVFKEQSKTLAEWAEVLNVNKSTLNSRLARGMTVEQAFNQQTIPRSERWKWRKSNKAKAA